MKHLVLLAIALFPLGCASTRTNALDVADSNDTFVVTAPSDDSVASTPDTSRGADYAEPFGAFESAPTPDYLAAEPIEPLASPAPQEKDLHGSRFTIKGGVWSSQEDELDDGFIVNLSWMRFFTHFFALEFEAGYFDADGSDGGVDADVWAVPIMVNGRFNIPLWILDLYAGAGIGGYYYDMEVSGLASDDDSGFLLGGNAFLGATVNLGEAMALGLEAKYYLSEEISDFDTQLDAYALMLTLGFSR